MSSLFSQTLREVPAEAKSKGHQYLLRAGFIRQLSAGIFSELLLARRALTKIEAIMREEINSINGQEIRMPIVHPAEIWKETGRWYQIGDEMGRFIDRVGRDMVLAMTHEEVVTDLGRSEVRSYRQLPLLLYQIQTKWRDDPRPRAGLIRAREFTMLDSYSLDEDEEGLELQYQAHLQAYFRIFNRCGLPALAVQSDVGMMGGSGAHEFMYLTPIGEDTILICQECGHMANRQIAEIAKPRPTEEGPAPFQKVATPGAHTIAELAAFLDIPESKTAKAVFMMATRMNDDISAEQLVFAVLRGDMELNETKLANALKAVELRPATEEEIEVAGAIPGYASPVGLEGVLIVVDDLIPDSPNLVAGANEDGYHLIDVNYGRDYVADIVADIVLAQDGDPCPECWNPMQAERAVEIGNIFKLGTRYSEDMGMTYLDKDGKARPVMMGSYGIGLGRLLACIAEEHHDEDGLIWPISVAPFEVHLIGLQGEETLADQLYEELVSNHFEILYDDRDERPGVKFKDADLIGLPLRLTLGPKSMEKGGVEMKLRHSRDRMIIPPFEVVGVMRSQINSLKAALGAEHDAVPHSDDG
ncbi:MAG: proline--tRNA ligase [Anaerolineales bacterium]|nr:proline--tRNA ligase [Anaerolineales bacterium]